VKKIFLLAGLPRSGSTLLGTLLNQNPNIYVPYASSFVERLWRNYSLWDDQPEENIGKKIQKIKIPFLKKLFQVYFSELTNKPIVIDKRRSWQTIANIKMFKEIFGEEPKIICTVRNVEEIIASYKSLYIQNKKKWDTKVLTVNRFKLDFSSLKYTWNSEFKNCLLLIEYNDLVKNTQKTINQIYDFIGQPYYQHDLKNIVSDETHKEVEELYDLKGMFNIPQTIQKSNTNIDILTGEEYKEYINKTFWKKNIVSERRLG